MIRFAADLEPLMVPAENVRSHPDNPNNGDVDEVVASVMKWGCYRPIYASRRTGYILGGHTLYAALLELGAQRLPVVFDDVTPAQEDGIILGDNQIARLARMDRAGELALLERVNETEHSLAGTGYTDDYLERLRLEVLGDITSDFHFEMEPDFDPHVTCPECGCEFIPDR